MFEEPSFPTPCTGRWAGKSDDLSHRLSVKMRTAHRAFQIFASKSVLEEDAAQNVAGVAYWIKAEKHLDASEYKTLLIYSAFGALPRSHRNILHWDLGRAALWLVQEKQNQASVQSCVPSTEH